MHSLQYDHSQQNVLCREDLFLLVKYAIYWTYWFLIVKDSQVVISSGKFYAWIIPKKPKNMSLFLGQGFNSRTYFEESMVHKDFNIYSC